MAKRKVITSGEIGEKIKRRRKELGLSQEELAEMLGVTYQQVQRYENGMNKLNVENVQLVADALSIPLSYFFDSYEVQMVAEEKTPYLTAQENKLLRLFRKIRNDTSKNTVLQVARLAAKAKG